MYSFKLDNKTYWIDGVSPCNCTTHPKKKYRKGLMANHSKNHPNMKAIQMRLGEKPRVLLETIKDITEGVELLYNYGCAGDRVSVQQFWMTKS